MVVIQIPNAEFPYHMQGCATQSHHLAFLEHGRS